MILPSNTKNPPFVGEDVVIYAIKLSAARDVEGSPSVKVGAQSVAVWVTSVANRLGLTAGRRISGAFVGECR